MIKKYIFVSIPYLLFSILLFPFYSCSHSSDAPEKTQITTSAESAGKASSASSHADEESGQGSNAESKINNNKGLSSVNHPPTVEKAILQLASVNNTDIIKVIATGMDKDNDEVTLVYDWFKNGEPAGSGDTISGFKRGDKLSAKITPFDGKDYGPPKILSIEINNSPPKITEYKEIKFDGNSYIGQIRASDPDGDSLTYSLKSAPSGMTIDSSTGLIKWNVPADFKEKVSFTISVTDGRGGEASQDLTIDIKPGQK
jgi:hypothetical protein